VAGVDDTHVAEFWCRIGSLCNNRAIDSCPSGSWFAYIYICIYIYRHRHIHIHNMYKYVCVYVDSMGRESVAAATLDL